MTLTQARSPAGDPAALEASTIFERLKPGPGHSPEEVRADQVARLHRAMIESAAATGVEHVTVRALTRMAGVSTRSFYSHFSNREECLGSAIDCVGHQILRTASRSAGPGGWDRKIKGLLGSLARDLAEKPKAARVLLIESLSADRLARSRAKELTSDLERLLSQLLATSPLAASPPRPLVSGITAGVVRVATMTTLTDRLPELIRISGFLSDWVVSIYDRETVRLAAVGQKDEARQRREATPLPVEMSSVGGYGDQERILAAVARLASERGFDALSIPRIRREAGVSRRAFDARFGGTSDCFLATVESLALLAAGNATTWAQSATGSERTYRRTLALCAIVARNQSLARLVLAEILSPGREGLLRREGLISAAVCRLAEEGEFRSPSRLVELEASVAATWRIAEEELVADNGRSLPGAARFLSRFFSDGRTS